MEPQQRPRTSVAGSWAVLSDMSDEPSVSSMSSLDPRNGNNHSGTFHPTQLPSPKESFGESIWFSGPLSRSPKASKKNDLRPEPVSMFARIARPITPIPLRRRFERIAADRNSAKHHHAPVKSLHASIEPNTSSADSAPDDDHLRFIDATDDLSSISLRPRSNHASASPARNPKQNVSTSPTSTISTDASGERVVEAENSLYASDASQNAAMYPASDSSSSNRYCSSPTSSSSQKRSVPKRLPRTRVFYQKHDSSHLESSLQKSSHPLGGVRAAIVRLEHRHELAINGESVCLETCLEQLRFDETMEMPSEGEDGRTEARFWLDDACYLNEDDEQYESSDEGDTGIRNRLDPDGLEIAKQAPTNSTNLTDDSLQRLNQHSAGVAVVQSNNSSPTRDHNAPRGLSHSLRALAPARRAISALKQQAAALAEQQQQQRDGTSGSDGGGGGGGADGSTGGTSSTAAVAVAAAANFLRPLTPLSQRRHHLKDRQRVHDGTRGLGNRDRVQDRIREQVRAHSALASESLTGAPALDFIKDDVRNHEEPTSVYQSSPHTYGQHEAMQNPQQLVAVRHGVHGKGIHSSEAAKNVAAGHRDQFIDLMSVAADAQTKRSKPVIFSRSGMSRLAQRLARHH